MGTKFVFLVAAAVMMMLTQTTTGQGVTSEILERINVDTYLQNRRLVEYHINCLLYSGPCDKIGNEIKRLFNSLRYAGITTTECRVCNPDQQRRLAKVARHWQTNYPKAWRDLNEAMRN
ncbi:ejaculatory bulb-specific protein 3 [Folsomia candida]|uniref:Ejaculatory bulb-specific protein 3 n=1 Tax=Folsomia candida TaxID=158441 RepID=A0A226DVY7_FOLCA|nr:ejaculatory bulb-specific protein 3 [Folsomia candida]OXA49240.1 Ejaculatory bulb-specific protein 3 [Folsomia candida]